MSPEKERLGAPRRAARTHLSQEPSVGNKNNMGIRRSMVVAGRGIRWILFLTCDSEARRLLFTAASIALA